VFVVVGRPGVGRQAATGPAGRLPHGTENRHRGICRGHSFGGQTPKQTIARLRTENVVSATDKQTNACLFRRDCAQAGFACWGVADNTGLLDEAAASLPNVGRSPHDAQERRSHTGPLRHILPGSPLCVSEYVVHSATANL